MQSKQQRARHVKRGERSVNQLVADKGSVTNHTGKNKIREHSLIVIATEEYLLRKLSIVPPSLISVFSLVMCVCVCVCVCVILS